MATTPPPDADGDAAGMGGWTCLTPPVCAHGESPVWRGLEDRLYWIDAGLQRLWRLHVPSGRSEFRELPQAPGALVPCRRGGWLIALRDGIYHLSDWNLPLERIADAPYDTRRVCFNDGKCDPWGRFWVGSSVDARDRPDAALYCLRARDRQRPELALIQSGVYTFNGLAWAPDGKLLYWADSHGHAVYTLPMVSAGQWPPVLGMRLLLKRFDARPADWRFEQDLGQGYGGRPDGAAIDSAGNYWVAMFEGARVLCLSPSGQILADWPVPAQCPTMVCFGGPDLRTLFVTTARQRRSAAELAHYPHSGAVFARRVVTPGLPPATYWD